MPLLLISEIFGLFASTLTADDKYAPPNSENIGHAIQIQFI